MAGNLMDERRCTATSKQSGERCRRAAIPGGSVCVMHGGAAPATRAAAGQRQAEAEADKLAEKLWVGLGQVPEVTEPGRMLQRLAGALAQMVDVLGDRLNALASVEAGKDLAQLRGVVVLHDRAVKNLGWCLDRIESLGLEQQSLQLERDQAAMVGFGIQDGFVASEMTPLQRELFTAAFLGRVKTPGSSLPPEIES